MKKTIQIGSASQRVEGGKHIVRLNIEIELTRTEYVALLEDQDNKAQASHILDFSFLKGLDGA